jgi:DNA-binding NarL/FixJ family response regulator
MNRIRILIADDHEMVRRGLRATLEERAGWEVVGEAGDGDEAVKLALKLRPDLLVLDVNMPKQNGLEVARVLQERAPKIRILVLTVHDSAQIVREILQAGAKGYLLKSEAGNDLITAVEAVLQDQPFLTPSVTSIVLDTFLKSTPAPAAAPVPPPAVPLSAREREVIQLLAQGHSNKEVARLLGISVKTVETHRTNLMRKLELHSITQLVRYAIRNGLVEP